MTAPIISGVYAPTGKFCKACRYCVDSLQDGRTVSHCARTDLVDGSGNNACTCHDERHNTDPAACGKAGQWWEAR